MYNKNDYVFVCFWRRYKTLSFYFCLVGVMRGWPKARLSEHASPLQYSLSVRTRSFWKRKSECILKQIGCWCHIREPNTYSMRSRNQMCANLFLVVSKNAGFLYCIFASICKSKQLKYMHIILVYGFLIVSHWSMLF